MTGQRRFSRKELKQPDDFVSGTNRFFDYYKTNQSIVLSMAMCILVIVGGVGFFWKNQEVKAIRMESLLLEMKRIQSRGDGSGMLVKYLSDFNEGTHKNRARLILADSYFREKKNADAVKVYEEILHKDQTNSLIRDLARFGLAQVYEQNKNRKQAITTYKSLIDKQGTLPLFHIYFSLARVYERERDYKNALLTLREMENQFKGHAKYDQIVSKIRELDELI